MAARSTVLKTFFLASALWMCRGVKAQEISQDFPFNLGQNLASDMQKIMRKSDTPAPSRAGFLFIRGPEADSSAYKNAAKLEPQKFKKNFKDYPVRTIGDGTDSIGINAILNALDELAKEEIETIVMINFMHGSRQFNIGQPDTTEGRIYFPFYCDNSLRYKSDESSFSADSLYKAIGDRFKTNKKLGYKNLIVVHQPCHAETALNAFHYLPSGTQVFYYSSVHNTAEYEPGDNAFSVAYMRLKNNAAEDKRPEPVMDVKTAFAASFISANAHFKTKRNDMRYLLILDEAADTAKVFNTKFHFGVHQGAVLNPDETIAAITKNFSDTQIQQDLAEYDAIIPPDEREKALKAYRNKIWMGVYDARHADCLNFIAVVMALKHDGYFRKSLSYGLSSEVRAAGCWVPPTSTVKGPTISQ